MIKYSCGFLFRHNRVLLVRKTHPEWQSGLLNGIGGRINDNETPVDGMRREFLEETTLPIEDWDHFATEIGRDYMCYFFRARQEFPKGVVPQHNDKREKLEWFDADVQPFRRGIVGNLQWLVPMALDPRSMRATIDVQKSDISARPTW